MGYSVTAACFCALETTSQHCSGIATDTDLQAAHEMPLLQRKLALQPGLCRHPGRLPLSQAWPAGSTISLERPVILVLNGCLCSKCVACCFMCFHSLPGLPPASMSHHPQPSLACWQSNTSRGPFRGCCFPKKLADDLITVALPGTLPDRGMLGFAEMWRLWPAGGQQSCMDWMSWRRAFRMTLPT